MHSFTSFIHEYVSPVCQGTHQVSENTTLYTQISKNGAATDLIQTDPDLNYLLRHKSGAPPIWPTFHLSGE